MYMTRAEANARERIIFERDYDSKDYQHGGVCYFEEISAETAEKLLDEGYLLPDDRQNDSPSAGEFVDFIMQHGPEKWYLHGYVISPERLDTRVTITGIGCRNNTDQRTETDFIMANRYAQRLVCEEDGTLYCWYD